MRKELPLVQDDQMNETLKIINLFQNKILLILDDGQYFTLLFLVFERGIKSYLYAIL